MQFQRLDVDEIIKANEIDYMDKHGVEIMLTKYTKLLNLKCEKDSAKIGILYTRRSTLYATLHQYDMALQDAHLAIQHSPNLPNVSSTF